MSAIDRRQSLAYPDASAILYLVKHIDEHTLIAGVPSWDGRMMPPTATGSITPACPYCGAHASDCRCHVT